MDGVFRHVEQLARYLLEGGARVDLAYSSLRKSPDLDELVATLEAAGGATLDLKVSNAPSWRDIGALRSLHAFVKQREPRVIHAHSSKAGILVRALRLLGEDATLLYTPHAYYGANPQGSALRNWVFNAVERGAGRFGVSINLNEAEARFAQERLHINRGRLRVIPNGVDSEKFRPAQGDEKARLRRQYGIPEDAMLLGTVGRANEQKDPITLYRGVLEAMRQNPHLHFFHLGWKGDAKLMQQVARMLDEAGVGERIHQHGYSSQPAFAYRMLDGFVMASRYEGMSYVILEALMSGLPLILTQAEGNRFLEDFNLPGLRWAGIGDAAALGGAIASWSQEGPTGPSEAHRKIAMAHFSNRSSCRRVALSYAQAIVGRRVRSFDLTFRSLLGSGESPHYTTRHA